MNLISSMYDKLLPYISALAFHTHALTSKCVGIQRISYFIIISSLVVSKHYAVIGTLDNGKAPGFDEITAEHLKFGGKELVEL